MWRVLVLLSMVCTASASAQEAHAGVGYAHIFRAGGFSFATGYLQDLGRVTSTVRHRLGGEFWYANTDVASQPAGSASRSLIGVGARYELELAHCCGRVRPLMALSVQALRSSIPPMAVALVAVGTGALQAVPGPPSAPAAEDQTGSAWGWGTGVELGLRVALSPQWALRTSGMALYQDVYAASTTNGAYALHLGLSYRFGS